MQLNCITRKRKIIVVRASCPRRIYKLNTQQLRTLRLATNQQINIFASEFLLLELETTLKRDKFQLRLQQRGYTVEDLMSVVKGLSNDCPTISIDAPQLRDPKDTVVLAAAVAANAEAIVTGDLDLLVLIEFNQIPIWTPQDFLSRYFSDS